MSAILRKQLNSLCRSHKHITNQFKANSRSYVFKRVSSKECFRAESNYLNMGLSYYSTFKRDGDYCEDAPKILTPHNSRMTINELANRLSEKLYDAYYKQSKLKPNLTKEKVANPAQGDWTCTYVLYWPERKTFESTAPTKRQSAEKAAQQALIWLLSINKITRKGEPIRGKEISEDITLNEPLKVDFNIELLDDIHTLVEEFENGIESRHKQSHEEALNMLKDNTSSGADENERFGTDIHPVYDRPFKNFTPEQKMRRKCYLERLLLRHSESPITLPIDEYAHELSSNTSRVTIIKGGPGCGKSTRAVIYGALTSQNVNCQVIVAEPRRVAAIGIAQSVAHELGEEVGQTVGYHVRLNAKPPEALGGNILFCTSGILLKKLRSNPGMFGCTHIYLDEAHERDVNTDLILLFLRRALDLNPGLSIVIMSATMNIDVFTSYFKESKLLEIPGKAYDVTNYYLDDICNEFQIDMSETRKSSSNDKRPYLNVTEIAEFIKTLDKTKPEGAILVFLPGWQEIKTLVSILEDHYQNSPLHVIMPVHSKLTADTQKKVFHYYPVGIRKIIISTNISETSVTIRDVKYVVDTGTHKENYISEQNGNMTLDTVWISKASAKQRSGRAGRIRDGICYKLYTKAREDNFIEFDRPEIKRVPLEKIILECKIISPEEKAFEFLSQLPEPPSSQQIRNALHELQEIDALTQSEDITPIGRALSELSIAVRPGMSLLHSSFMSCQDSVTAAVTLSENGGRIFSDDITNEEIREIKSKVHPNSDHISLSYILNEYTSCLEESPELLERFCDSYKLRKGTLQEILDLSRLHRAQLTSAIYQSHSDNDKYSDSDDMTVMSMISGYDTIAAQKSRVKTSGKLRRVVDYYNGNQNRIHIKPESVNYKTNNQDLLMYTHGMHSKERKALVVECTTTRFNALTVLLGCCGKIDLEVIEKEGGHKMAVLDVHKHKLKIETDLLKAELILKLRSIFKSSFKNYIDEKYISSLDEDSVNVEAFRFKIVDLIYRMLTNEIK